jgi:hypothetical protein
MGSSPRFDIYGCDFGWGKPLAARSGRANKFDDKASLYPGWDDGCGINAELVLTPENMARLEQDRVLGGSHAGFSSCLGHLIWILLFPLILLLALHLITPPLLLILVNKFVRKAPHVGHSRSVFFRVQGQLVHHQATNHLLGERASNQSYVLRPPLPRRREALEWDALEAKIRRWIHAAHAAVRGVFARERRLCFTSSTTASERACWPASKILPRRRAPTGWERRATGEDRRFGGAEGNMMWLVGPMSWEKE